MKVFLFMIFRFLFFDWSGNYLLNSPNSAGSKKVWGKKSAWLWYRWHSLVDLQIANTQLWTTTNKIDKTREGSMEILNMRSAYFLSRIWKHAKWVCLYFVCQGEKKSVKIRESWKAEIKPLFVFTSSQCRKGRQRSLHSQCGHQNKWKGTISRGCGWLSIVRS